ncbi:lysophospholipase [Candidatus Babeliales bacterium]|nr:lysophospholipase [Candidatus Babeliales bacterium]
MIHLSRSSFFIALGCFFITLMTVLGISYYTVYRFVSAGDRIVYGTKLSTLTVDIRSELLKRSDVQHVAFTTSDNFELQGLLFARPHAQANLVLCHGYQGCKEFMYGLIDMFPTYNILIFDFRAHGQSPGSTTSIGCHEYKDVIAAADFMKQYDNTLPLIVLGISMGGASALKAAEVKQDLCDALIIDSTFSELKTMFLRGFTLKVGLPYYPFFPIARAMFHYVNNCDIHNMSPVESVKKIKQPILFIHSCNDKFINPENSLQLYAVAQNKDTRLWIGPRCRHGWLHTYHTPMYQKKVLRFLDQTIFSSQK